MESKLMDFIFSKKDPRQAAEKYLPQFKHVRVNEVMNWEDGSRPEGKEFIRVHAQILRIKRLDDKHINKMFNSSSRDPASKQQRKLFFVDRDTRYVLLR
jgi:hypothetical protein